MNRIALVGAYLSFTLAACGAGGGGGVVSTPSPPPQPPPPPPAPPPLASEAIIVFPQVKTTTDFATIGYESPGNPIEVGSLTGTGFSVSYNADSNSYTMDLPASNPGQLVGTPVGDRYWGARLTDPSSLATNQPIFLYVFRPGPQNWDFPNLEYTSFAFYESSTGPSGAVAFGLATPSSGVPVAGSATYKAFAAGELEGLDFAVRGSVTLAFNFGSGTLSGSFDPYIYDLLSGNSPLGHYEFVNTVFGVGSTTFSGELSSTSTSQRGSFNGMFTGPAAEELMARWTAPLHNPSTGTASQMFGVWVGRRQ